MPGYLAEAGQAKRRPPLACLKHAVRAPCQAGGAEVIVRMEALCSVLALDNVEITSRSCLPAYKNILPELWSFKGCKVVVYVPVLIVPLR